jgi:hypothetical protein
MIPLYVQNRSEPIRNKWTQIHNTISEQHGSATGTFVANKWLQRELTSNTLSAKTINSPKLEILKFNVSNSGFISKTEDGQEYMEYTLANTKIDKEGDIYPIELIQKWSDYINSGNVLVGDIDHEEYNKWIASGLPEDQIIENIKKKPGIAKAIQSFIENGALKIRTFIDKRYKKLVSAANGVSLEAIITRNGSGKIVDGNLLGFTFGINQPVAINV